MACRQLQFTCTRVILCVALFVVTCCSAAAPDDPKAVTVQIVGERLATGVPSIGDAAEVRLAVDRTLAEHRIFLFAHKQPLDTIRKQLREFVPEPPGKAIWSKEGSVLVLREDMLSRSRRAKRAAEGQRLGREHRMRGYQSMLAWCAPNPQDPPYLAKQRARDSELVRIFAGVPLAARQAAFNGLRVAVPFQDLDPAAQALVRQAVREERSGVTGRPELAFDGRKNADRVRVEITPVGTVEYPGLRLWLNCQPSQNGRYFPDIVNRPRWDPAQGWSWDHLRNASASRARGPQRKLSNPAFETRVSLVGGAGAVIEKVLAEFEREAHLPVLGDYDPCYVSPFAQSIGARRSLPSGAVNRMPVRKALEIIAQTFDLTWEYHEGWIWFRSSRTPLA
ncbi:MAG: hypothetical protein ACO1SX_13455, partial [Actinomycetota bacterium]